MGHAITRDNARELFSNISPGAFQIEGARLLLRGDVCIHFVTNKGHDLRIQEEEDIGEQLQFFMKQIAKGLVIFERSIGNRQYVASLSKSMKEKIAQRNDLEYAEIDTLSEEELQELSEIFDQIFKISEMVKNKNLLNQRPSPSSQKQVEAVERKTEVSTSFVKSNQNDERNALSYNPEQKREESSSRLKKETEDRQIIKQKREEITRQTLGARDLRRQDQRKQARHDEILKEIERGAYRNKNL